MTKYWWVTFKYNKPKDEIYAQDYMDLVTALLQRYSKGTLIIDNCFEYDSEGRMHFHFIMATQFVRWAFFCKHKVTPETKLHIHNIEISADDIDHIRKYMSKNRQDPYNHDQKLYTHQLEAEDYPFTMNII